MWPVALISILNACLNNDFVNSSSMRLEIAGLPMNIYDMLLVVALGWSLVPAGSVFGVDRFPRTMVWTIGLFTTALILGILGALRVDAFARQIVTDARNFAVVLLAIIAGYRATKTLGSANFYCYVIILSGILVATIIPFDFARAAGTLKLGKDVTQVRVVQYTANYGGLAAGLLVFCLGFKGRPLLPRILCVLIAAYCVVGASATLSRSDWLAIAAGILAAVAIIPRVSVARKFMLSLVWGPVFGLFLFGGMYAAQQISGKDMFTRMLDRVKSIVGMQEKGAAASDSRLAATFEELGMWADTPVTVVAGGGFGVHEAAIMVDYSAGRGGFRHNTWVSTLAETGVVGFSAMALAVFGQMVVGYRMVKRRLDRRTVFVGALGVVTGAHYVVHGLTTMSFNQVRGALPLAIMCGVVFRTRAIEKTLAAMYAGYLPDPNDPATASGPLFDAGTSTRPPSLPSAPAGAYGRAGWAGQAQEDYASY